jgi:hypothetical protein
MLNYQRVVGDFMNIMGKDGDTYGIIVATCNCPIMRISWRCSGIWFFGVILKSTGPGI